MPNVYEIITDRIIQQLEAGTAPWHKPWSTPGQHGLPRNLLSGHPYRGINVWILASSGYGSPYWLTFKQAHELGGHIRKGEKGMPVAFWKFGAHKVQDGEEIIERKSVICRYYTVFNFTQCRVCECKRLRLQRTRKAWAKNARIAKANPKRYFSQIANSIADRRPRQFRWHVAGDILSVDYLRQMCRIAVRHPRTQSLAFTKAFNVVNDYEDIAALPANLVVIFSAWPRMKIDNPHGHCIAWMQDGTEGRVPKDALECPGDCENCGTCFQLPKLRRDVVFQKH